ncbi:unnamed protein product [Bursaphelenchus okinawaensis]|uniref:Uncharacterized protein n=1 Tax=Bursaphelenchus okinawaensis TaxID=465554 RepID=A0A811KP86_9BILA|nr:unnamed protein product [Bursaphelenchus okinawaensis]CAG9107515.1 unnamed protein product [Bursaphelenchus okinawaensis]
MSQLVSRTRTSSTMVCVCLILCFLVLADCFEEVSARVYVVKSQKKPAKKCRVHINTHLHVVMDRICLLCHEMFSHENPNFRADCSSNCYKSEHFRRCLNVFGPIEAPKLLSKIEHED